MVLQEAEKRVKKKKKTRREICRFEKKSFWIDDPKIVLDNPETRDYLKLLQTQYVIVPIGNANNDVAFVWKNILSEEDRTMKIAHNKKTVSCR